MDETRGKERTSLLMVAFFDELLLYSGQYALFYILMNFAKDGGSFFRNFGHTTLLFALFVQTAALVRWGGRPLPRFLLSLTAPIVYALVESTEGPAFLLDMSHVFFWIFTAATAVLQAAALVDIGRRLKMAFEFCITLLNVAAFFLIYVYFDIRLAAAEAGVGQVMARETFSIFNAGKNIASFMEDSAHVYIVMGGAVMAVTLAVGRVKILTLKERINDLFGQYVDPSFRDEILKGGGRPRKRDLCILFADIRNFTPLSEAEDPARISGMLNAYFTEWEETVSRYGGTVDKYIGDAVMAIFGAKGNDGCDAAASCAIEMLHRFPRLRERLAAAGLPTPSAIGVGMDYGTVTMGDLGSRRRKNYTVIGDHVNTASRLESLCKDYGRPIIVSAATYERFGEANALRFEPLEKAAVKGKREPLEVYGLRI
jgi:class 3 adenylate cyclase